MPPSRAAQPTRNIFDAWNSSSTGHQRAENRLSGSTAWRDSRTTKLHAQLSDAAQAGQSGGTQRLYDTVGAGSEFFGRDGRRENGSWERGASGLRDAGQRAIGEFWRVGKGKGKEVEQCDGKAGEELRSSKRRKLMDASTEADVACSNEDEADEETELEQQKQRPKQPAQQQPHHKQVFANLTFYVNGSTYPTISDHKLKRLLCQHGGTLALGLARRRVTHVILGRPCSSDGGKGTGGGLAARKLQKEISSGASGRGGINAGIRHVSAEWVLECVRVGKRVAEWSGNASSATSVGTGPRQASVLGVFEREAKTAARDAA